MPALPVIAPFLALIDRSVALLKRRETKQREYFKEIIEPLYEEFKPLGDDCLQMFRDALALLKSRKRPNAEQVALVTREARKFKEARARLRALANVCKADAIKRRDPELHKFVTCIGNFFVPVSDRLRGDKEEDSIPTRLAGIYYCWHNGGLGFVGRFTIPEITGQLESMHYEIAGRYMELKIKSLGHQPRSFFFPYE